MIPDEVSADNVLPALAIISSVAIDALFRKHEAIMLILCGKTGTIIDANDTALQFYNYSFQQITSKSISDIDPQCTADMLMQWRKALKGSDVRTTTSHRLAGGEMRSVNVHVMSFAAETDTYFILTIYDISTLHKAEETRQANEIKFRSLFETSPDAILLVDAENGKIVESNPSATRLYGYTKYEFLRLRYADLCVKQDKFDDKMSDLFSKGFLHWHKKQDGALFPVEISRGNFMCGTSHIETMFIRDMTEKQKAADYKQRIDKLDSLGVLVSGIAHDFNNLLGGIFGNIEMANDKYYDEKVTRHLLTAMSMVGRARNLTRQLLTFSTGGTMVRQSKQLFPFIQDIVLFALSGSNVSVRFDNPDNLWPCDIDIRQISQVIDNIVTNARQATPDGGRIEITTENIASGKKVFAALHDGPYVKLSIHDNGIGIPPDILPRIFDPYFTTKPKGHGLGLSASYSIIKSHGGDIDVESVAGKGTTFRIYLPAINGSTASINPEEVLIHTGKGRILVMDDEHIMRQTISDMLQSMGYSVVCTSNGKETIDVFSTEYSAGRTFVAVLLDLTVPDGMGGKEVCTEIRQRNTGIPVFITSGYTESAILANAQSYGFTDCIRKPFSKIELSLMLAKHLNSEL